MENPLSMWAQYKGLCGKLSSSFAVAPALVPKTELVSCVPVRVDSCGSLPRLHDIDSEGYVLLEPISAAVTPIPVDGSVPATKASACNFLSGLDNSAQKEILAAAEYRKTEAKEILIRAGEKATHLFLLSSGNAKYFRISQHGDEHLLHWVVPGDVFGLATLLRNPPPYMGSAQTIEPCEIYRWSHFEVRRLAHSYPQLAENALRIALRYLTEFADRHKNFATRTAEQRLAGTLLNLAQRAGRQYPGGVQVDVTNEQLGSLADVGMFTASRTLKKWERAGAIGKLRGRVLLKAPEKLLTDLTPVNARGA
jgi:CRP-like cAMP-binding protein